LELDTAFGLIAGVLVLSALAAGLVERAPLSFPMLFLGLGFLLGDRASGSSRSAWTTASWRSWPWSPWP
jgi:hypothetical protein